jgi:predicted permease
MRTFLGDLRYALRTLSKSPGFVLAAILSLGLGIGANTAIFSLLDALMLRPLPVRDPQQLVHIGSIDRQRFVQPLPGPMFNWLRQDPLLDGICGVRVPPWAVEVKREVLQVAGHALSGDCYEMLGVRPAIGRLFDRQDDIPNGPLVTVLSYAFWHEQFGGDANVIGQIIRIQGAPFTIIGVTEPRFQGLLLGFPPSVSIPITQERADPLVPQKLYWGDAFARLKPGLGAEQVRTQLTVDWRRFLDESLPPNIQGAERTETLNRPLAVIAAATGLDYSMRKRFKRPLLAVLGISALVLLVSCLNLANLLLARGLRQRRDVAVRLALGARRWQIVRQVGAESLILIVAGLGCALLLAYVGSEAMLAALSRAFRGFSLAVGPDAGVMAFTSGTALTALVLFGVLPARQTSDVDLAHALKSGTPSRGGGHSRSRRFLICGQVALTLALLMGASFFVEMLRQLRDQSFGFHVDSLATMQLLPLPGGYVHGFNSSTYYRELLERIQHLPGVQSACLSKLSPLFTIPYKEEIQNTQVPDEFPLQAPAEMVSDGFLATMQIPLLQGEDFRRTDSPQIQKTAIVSKSLATRLFPAGDALGQHIRVGSEKDTQDVQIVAVAADARLMDPRAQDLSFVYLNYWQYPDYEKYGDIQFRYSGDPAVLIFAVRQELRQAGREYPMYVRTIEDQRDISLLQERLLASLGTMFGILALTLAGVGLFGLLSVFVTSRTSEIGIRMALGAERRDVGWLVIQETLVLVGAGLLIGLPLSYAAVHVFSSQLYGASQVPIIPFGLSAALLLSVAGIATVIPVRRATALDPMVALRYE